jgi:hypothetical protein
VPQKQSILRDMKFAVVATATEQKKEQSRKPVNTVLGGDKSCSRQVSFDCKPPALPVVGRAA